ncbi:transcription factor HHO2-like [Momordica charantia]|uniref:Transcription factor HHO2-like n=1 Tax=Momordica charantia TaxID=3673 RepID=A0A6J1D9L0_MOMCH|nr:transcription factor HHO2-like [Momordica charantia]
MDFVDNILDIRVGMDLRHYADALDQERRKIQVFQRELPLCLDLVTRAIESCRQQFSGLSTESSEHTSSDGPVLEEFIPINKIPVTSHSEDEQSEPDKNDVGRSDWLKSAQLWNQTPDPPITEDVSKKTTSVVGEVKNNGGGGAFQPFQKEKSPLKTEAAPVVGKTLGSSSVPEATTSSTAETASKGSGGTSKREDKESQTQRKQRRCWSSELHRRFLHALQQLGGPHVATPKQIRELMKVEGLTNDEVKSHLQKYRLHARRPTNSAMQDSGNSSAPPQFVVVGSIWVPQPPKSAAVATPEVRNGIYAPVATPVPSSGKTQRPRQRASDHSAGVAHSNSPATSSSTHTTTASPSA